MNPTASRLETLTRDLTARIVSGEYVHRGQERPAREEASAAAAHYSERFRDLFRETGRRFLQLPIESAEHVEVATLQAVA